VSQCSCGFAPVQRERDGQPDGHDREPAHQVEDKVVGGRDDGEPHRERRDDREHPDGEMCGRQQEDDADDEVPPEVQARERRVLIREAGRLQGAVRARFVRDRVHESEPEQSWWSDGKEGEKEEADPARDEECIAQEVVAIAAIDVEGGRDAEDHGPVAPDVDPVREHHGDVAADDRPLDRLLPGEVERLLEVDDSPGVVEGLAHTSDRLVPDPEVREHRGCDEGGLADEGVARAPREPASRRDARCAGLVRHRVTRAQFHGPINASVTSIRLGAIGKRPRSDLRGKCSPPPALTRHALLGDRPHESDPAGRRQTGSTHAVSRKTGRSLR
jgi:hypothetical protein